jgi:hypothetical protein
MFYAPEEVPLEDAPKEVLLGDNLKHRPDYNNQLSPVEYEKKYFLGTGTV